MLLWNTSKKSGDVTMRISVAYPGGDTQIVNVPINSATGRWNPDRPPADWKQLRRRWELFQAVRAWLLLSAFAFLSIGFATN